MKVYTFLGPVEGKQLQVEEALIDLWSKNWTAEGWEPVVLTPADVSDTAENRRLLKKFDQLPTTNKKGLDKWCYARWLAVAEKGGGVMSDYDVMNYGFKPLEPGLLTIHAGLVPCLVSGTQDQFMRAVGWFDAVPTPFWKSLFRSKKEHTSDMLIVREHKEECIVKRCCLKYLLDGWDTAEAVHYSNSIMKPNKMDPRHDWIPKLRPLKY